MARKLEIEIVGDASSFKRALGDSDSASSKFGRALGGMAKAGALAAGAAGVGALFVTLRAGIGEFTEATKVAAQTEAVIKSTGGVANVTAKHVDDLASSVMRYSGIDDEAVKSGQNLLLTFKQVRNEVGRGNAVFDRATKAAIDLSVAGFGSIETTAKQLGKALNDPIRGMTALGRAGVTFTQAQRDQIKALVESNKTLEAQKLILKEVESQVGGSARALGETLPGQINILKETFNNLAGDLVSKAVPAVTTFVTFLNEKGVPAIENVFGRLSEVAGPALDQLGESLKAAGPIITGVLEPLGKVIKENLVPVFVQLQEIGTEAMRKIGDIIRQNGPQIRQIFENLGTVISNLAKVVVPLLKFAFTEVLPVAIKILIPILELVTGAMAKISTAVRVVGTAIEAVLIPAMRLILNVGGTLANFLGKALAFALEVVVAPIKNVASVLKSVLAPAFDAVTKAAGGVQTVFEWFKDKATAIWGKLAKAIPPVISPITGAFQALNDILYSIIRAIDGIVGRVDDIIDAASKIKGAVGGLIGKIPGLQHGGVAEKGRAYVVGERGPELFVPGVTGTVIPSYMTPQPVAMGAAATSGAGGGGLTVNVYGNLLTSKRELEDMVRGALYDVSRRNPGALPGVA